MARKPRGKRAENIGEFAGPDADKAAIDKLAEAARKANEKAATAKSDNGGPLMDEAAWRRACNELVAEEIDIESMMEQVAEARGRISSIRKVAKSLGVDWAVVKDFGKYQKRIRHGGMGEIVTEHRRLGSLMKLMNCPLYTQFSLWPEEAKDGAPAKPGMDADLQGQHAWANSEPISNNPFAPGAEDFVSWDQGWHAAQAAKARTMAPNGGAEAR